MAAKPETKFISRVHKKLPPKLYHMKNHNAYTGGIADVWYSGTKADLWVEYKFIERLPVNVPVRPPELLTALQLAWLKDRLSEGRNVAVIIGTKGGGVVLTNHEWEHEIPVPHFKSLIRSDADLAGWIKEQIEQ